MKRKILSILMCFSMIAAVLPTIAFAVDETYNLWVGDVQVTSANAADVLSDGTVSYDNSTKTLTLNEANITTPTDKFTWSYWDAYAGIRANEGITINLIGNSTVDISGHELKKSMLHAIHCNDNLTIQGNGALTAVSGAATNNSSSDYRESVAIHAAGTLTFERSVNVTAHGGTSECDSAGVRSETNQIILKDSAVLIASGDKVTARSRTSTGVWGPITVQGGTLIASGEKSAAGTVTVANGYKIYAGNDASNAAVQSGTSYNGESVKYIKVEQGSAFPISFTVTNIPKGGEKTATIGNGIDITGGGSEYLVIPDQYAASVTDSERFDYFEGTFQKGTTYYGSALIIPMNDEGITGTPTFNITGGSVEKYELVYTADDEPTGEIKVYFSVPVTEDAAVISSVDLSNVTLPAEGEDYFEPDISDGEHYTIDFAYWADDEGEVIDEFNRNQNCYLTVNLKPERGYIFADNVQVSVNSGAAETVTAKDVLGRAELSVRVPVAPSVGYGVYIDGVQITDANKDDVLGDGTVSYDADENVLILNNSNITAEANNKHAAIYADGDLVVWLTKGSLNNVTYMDAAEGNGIYVHGELIVGGRGSLNAECTTGSSMYGVYTDSNLRVFGGAKLTGRAAMYGKASGGAYKGVYSGRNIYVSGRGSRLIGEIGEIEIPGSACHGVAAYGDIYIDEDGAFEAICANKYILYPVVCATPNGVFVKGEKGSEAAEVEGYNITYKVMNGRESAYGDSYNSDHLDYLYDLNVASVDFLALTLDTAINNMAVIFAEYDEDGVLMHVEAHENLSASANTELKVDKISPPEGYEMKIMIWDSVKGMRPYTEVIKIGGDKPEEPKAE